MTSRLDFGHSLPPLHWYPHPSLPRLFASAVAIVLIWSLMLCGQSARAASDDDNAAVASLIVQLRPVLSRHALGVPAETANTHRGRLDQVIESSNLPLRSGRAVAADWQVVDVGRMLTLREARAYAARLRADPGVAAVAINRREQRLLAPNDPLFTTTDPTLAQWWLQAVGSGSEGVPGMTRAWDQSAGAPVGGAAAAIAVLDSGITSHAELNSKLVPGYDFVSDANYGNDGDGRDNDPSDPGDALPASVQAANPALYSGCEVAENSTWHGTLIAGQVAAVSNNAAGVAGINWSARILPVRVAGRCGAALGDIIDGLRWAAGLDVDGVPTNQNPARVITLSYGSQDSCDPNSSDPTTADTAKLYQQVIAEVRQQGALVFVAAGNGNQGGGRPASCSGVVAVAALNRQGFKAKYSNFGSQVAIATVGGDDNTGKSCDNELADTGIVSTSNLGDVNPAAAGYAAGSGTSFAAPVVAGVVSLMLAVRPELTVDQIEGGLKRSARPHALVPRLGGCGATPSSRCACTTATCGAGILDAAQALSYATDPVAYAAPASSPVSLDNSAIQACATLLGLPAPDPTAPTEPTPVPPTEPPVASSGGGGGGALGLEWLAALGGAIVLLAVARIAPGKDQATAPHPVATRR